MTPIKPSDIQDTKEVYARYQAGTFPIFGKHEIERAVYVFVQSAQENKQWTILPESSLEKALSAPAKTEVPIRHGHTLVIHGEHERYGGQDGILRLMVSRGLLDHTGDVIVRTKYLGFILGKPKLDPMYKLSDKTIDLLATEFPANDASLQLQ